MITATKAINELLEQAIALKVSDIHFDPGAYDNLVRFRLDGMLKEYSRLPLEIKDEIISRLKILSGARTDIHSIPQDGRYQISIAGIEYNIRISFMPTYHGENAVMRLLPVRTHKTTSLTELGFICDHVDVITSALTKTSGLILVTGPTGSGKTTTLHTCLSIKSLEPISIITLEDPVEYEIPSVRQIHIKHDYGVTFASGLRSSLRQDPDVIMVGEIRDSETAQIAIHTALTGHLVLSTLHTNSAIETIPRLIDMGVDPYLLATTLKLIIAQRLVRTICEQCNGVGCDLCHNTGYLGRTIIAEACHIDKELSDLISTKRPVTDIESYIQSRGFRTIKDDGLEKVEWGITSLAEILRVLTR